MPTYFWGFVTMLARVEVPQHARVSVCCSELLKSIRWIQGIEMPGKSLPSRSDPHENLFPKLPTQTVQVVILCHTCWLTNSMNWGKLVCCTARCRVATPNHKPRLQGNFRAFGNWRRKYTCVCPHGTLNILHPAKATFQGIPLVLKPG